MIKRIKVENVSEERHEVPVVDDIVTRTPIKSADSEDWLYDVLCLGENMVDAEDVNATEIKKTIMIIKLNL